MNAQFEFAGDVKQFFDSADQALYQAKQAGRNRSILAPLPEPNAGS